MHDLANGKLATVVDELLQVVFCSLVMHVQAEDLIQRKGYIISHAINLVNLNNMELIHERYINTNEQAINTKIRILVTLLGSQVPKEGSQVTLFKSHSLPPNTSGTYQSKLVPTPVQGSIHQLFVLNL